MPLTPTDQLILYSVKINPIQADLDRLSSLIPKITDWEYLTKTAIERGIGPLLFKKLSLLTNASLIPEQAKKNLKGVYYRTLSRNVVLYDAFSNVTKAFTDAGIQVVALKGIYLSEWLYKDIGLRQLSDIDLLVKEEDGETCIEILKAIGFKGTKNTFSEHLPIEKEFVHYPPMMRNNVSVEIHIRLHKKNPDYNIRVADFIKNSEPVIVNKVNVHTLQLYDLLIYLCVHSEKHFTGSSIQFTCFSDIANLLYENSDKLDWKLLATLSRENQCEVVVFKHLLLVNKFFDAPVPEEISQKYLSVLTEQDENKFLMYLNGYFNVGNHISLFSTNVNQIKGFRHKLIFITGNMFPPKHYMVERYKIKNEVLFGLYYPYRWWLVLKGLTGKFAKKSNWVKK